MILLMVRFSLRRLIYNLCISIREQTHPDVMVLVIQKLNCLIIVKVVQVTYVIKDDGRFIQWCENIVMHWNRRDIGGSV